MPNPGDLVSPSGQPLIPEPKYIVLKCPRSHPIPPQVAHNISQIAKSPVIVLPMDAEILAGTLAKNEMDSMHNSLHAIQDMPIIHFTTEDIQMLYSAMKFLCEQTAPARGSREVTMMKELKQVLPSTVEAT